MWEIRHETTIPYCPEQAGVAERANRTIMEKNRSMLRGSNLPNSYWVQASKTAVYLKNRSPVRSIGNQVPEEIWTSKRIDLSHLRVFGCVAYAHVPDQLRKKLDVKSKRYYFVGYCEAFKGYYLADPHEKGKIIKARDVVFFEDTFCDHVVGSEEIGIAGAQVWVPGGPECSGAENDENESTITGIVDVENVSSTEYYTDTGGSELYQSDSESTDDVESSEGRPRSESGEAGSSEGISDHDSSSDFRPGTRPLVNVERRYPERERHFPRIYTDYVTNMVCIGNLEIEMCPGSGEPQSVKEAFSLDRPGWEKAMKQEWETLNKKGVYSLVDLPSGKKLVKCKWVFKRKVNAAGEVERYRARLVARGFTQQYGIDYVETFSPVVSYPALRLLIALAVELDLKIFHLDVTAAFLNGNLKETIYMEQPEGLVEEPGKVWQLHKAIYGLKQASKSWYDFCKKVLKSEIGLNNLPTEPCIYYSGKGLSLCIVAVYVDDFLVLCKDRKCADDLAEKLKCHFELRNLGEARSVLGMRITVSKNSLKLDQSEYIKNITAKFGQQDSVIASTPMEAKLQLEPGVTGNLPNVPYQMLVGSLMYAMVCTRPDISYAVGKLSRFNSCYTKEHYSYAKRVLRYLNGTIEHGLHYCKTGVGLEGFADADWANDKSDRKSTTGFFIEIGRWTGLLGKPQTKYGGSIHH